MLLDDASAVLRLGHVRGDRVRTQFGRRRLDLLGVRDASVSANPSSRSIFAIARPMPDEPPVMSAEATGFDYFRNVKGVVVRMANLGANPRLLLSLSATAAPRPPLRRLGVF